MDLFSSFLLASWTFDGVDGDMPKYWIFIAGFLYIFVIMVYLKVHSSRRKVEAPMFAVLRGIVHEDSKYLITYSLSLMSIRSEI